jgi:hypothetical protein
MRSNQQYEAGLNKVSSDYSSIVNAPLTNNDNIEQRKQYISQIQDGLKKVAPTDLSLPQNVAQAENLYAPFWQDTPMLQDMSYTKYAQGELSKNDAWNSSTDKATRAQSSPYNAQYIQQGLNKLATTDRSNIGKLQRRSVVPFYDIDSDIDAAYKEEGDKGVDTTSVSGNGIVTEHNGIKSKDAFKAWYLSKLGSKYDPQLYITEAVKVQNQKDEILKANPGIDEQTLNQHFAGEQLGKLNSLYQGNIDSFSKLTDQWSQKYNDLYTQIQKQPGKRATPEQVSSLNTYQDKVKTYQEQVLGYSNEFKKYGAGDPTSDNYQKTLQDITEHPEDYLANIQKNIMADNWASGMSVMDTHTKVDLDPRWQAYQTEHDKQLERQIEAAKVSAENWKTEEEYRKSTGRTTKGEPLPGFDPSRSSGWYGDKGTGNADGTGTGIPNPGTGSFTGEATADIAHLPQGLDIVTTIQKQNIDRVSNGVYNPEGLAGALGVDGLSRSDIINFTEGAKAGMNGQHPTTDQANAWNKVKQVLSNNGIPTNDIHGPQEMQQALIQYSALAAGKLLHSGNTDKIIQGKQLIDNYLNISQDRDVVLANQRTYDQAVNSEIFSHPETYGKMITTNPDGTKRYITPVDMAKDFPSVQLGDNNGNKVKDLSPLEFAQLYREGKVKPIGQNALEVDGKVFGVVGINGEHPGMWGAPAGVELEKIMKVNKNSIQNKYGEPGEFSDLQKKASAAVVPHLKGYETGLIAQNLSFDPAIKSQMDMAVGVSKELANPANIDASTAYQEGFTPNNTPNQKKAIDAVRGIIFSKDDMATYTSGPQRTITPEGIPAYAYTFKANAPDKIVGVDGVKISDLAGKTYVLPLSPNANAPYLNSIPQSSGQYVHSDLLYNTKPTVSDPIIQASGFKSVIHPYAPIDGKNTKCDIEIQKAIPDIKHPGQTTWVPIDQSTFNMLKGDRAKTPDELVAITNALLSQHLNGIVSDAKTKEINIPDNAPVLK